MVEVVASNSTAIFVISALDKRKLLYFVEDIKCEEIRSKVLHSLYSSSQFLLLIVFQQNRNMIWHGYVRVCGGEAGMEQTSIPKKTHKRQR